MTKLQERLLRLIKIFTILILTYVQAFWAMSEFGDNVSCSLSSSFELELVFIALFVLILIAIVRYFCKKIKLKKNAYIGVLSLATVLLWFYFDYDIFINWEACWSTYLTSEAVMYTLNYSTVPILVCICILVLVFYLPDFLLRNEPKIN